MRIITIGFSTLAIAALLSGCAAVDSLTDATKDKSIAAGSDTWGGGADISAVSAESPVPCVGMVRPPQGLVCIGQGQVDRRGCRRSRQSQQQQS